MDVHDCIHIVLGRGLLPIDEAFVLGFTMGCTDRFSSLQQRAFPSVVRRFYPQDYRFTPEQEKVFQDAAALGFISDCRPLADVDFEVFMDKLLNEVRKTWASRNTCFGPTSRRSGTACPTIQPHSGSLTEDHITLFFNRPSLAPNAPSSPTANAPRDPAPPGLPSASSRRCVSPL